MLLPFLAPPCAGRNHASEWRTFRWPIGALSDGRVYHASRSTTIGPNGSISGTVLSPGGGPFFSESSTALVTFRNTKGELLGGGSIALGQNGACISCYHSLDNIRSGPVHVIVEWSPNANYWRGDGWFSVEPGQETTGADVTLSLQEL